jgi:hypothetical protein
MNPMHRTDIEGFGHYEDRREMEQYAGSVGGQGYTTAAAATTYAASAPTYTTNVAAGQYVSGFIPASNTSNVVSNNSLRLSVGICPIRCLVVCFLDLCSALNYVNRSMSM